MAKSPCFLRMLDLSEDPNEKNIQICAEYFKRMAPSGLWLEMEIGITGGEEDGVDNTGVDNASLYTQPEDVYDVYKTPQCDRTQL